MERSLNRNIRTCLNLGRPDALPPLLQLASAVTEEGGWSLYHQNEPRAITRPHSLQELERIVVPIIETVDRQGGSMLNSAGRITVVTPEENTRRIFEIAARYW